MASIRENKNKQGRVISYTITVSCGRGKDGKQILKYATFKHDNKKSARQNKNDLDRFAMDFEDKCKSGQIVAEKITLQEYTEKRLSSFAKTLEKTTYSNYLNNLEKIILPRLGHLKLSNIRVSTVQDFLDDLRTSGYDYGYRKGAYSERTVQTAKKVLSTVLSDAVRDNIIPNNPCTVRMRQNKTEDKPVIKSFDLDQANRFLDLLENPIPIIIPERIVIRHGKEVLRKEYTQGSFSVSLKYKAMFVVTIFSGMRKEEIFGLQWRDIDFNEHSIDINKACVYLGDGVFEIKSPKSASGYRKIFLPQSCMDVLRQLKREHQKMIMKMGSAWVGSRDIEKCFCFVQDNGEHMYPSTPRAELQRIIRAYNKTCKNDADKLPIITFHQLRHTNASILIAQGMEATAVAKRLGHHNASVTLSIYAHSFEERDRAASDALEAALIRRQA
ncbi:MAG: site-specific integrase [Lachnospiraceae bacterium]|nr:site-specific integrase [Lachnospiraceae bacterium]